MQGITVALASKPFVNGDIGANLTAVLAAMAEGTALGADLVCFGEAFLQGFDSLCVGDSHGGCAAFLEGNIAALLPPGREGLLTVRPLALMKGGEP